MEESSQGGCTEELEECEDKEHFSIELEECEYYEDFSFENTSKR